MVTRGELGPDDLIVFATDALAQRLLAEVESGTPPDWGRFWDLDQETWRQEIEALRDQNAIVNDDCTLVVLRLPRPAAEPAIVPDSTPADESPAPVSVETPGTESPEILPPVDSAVLAAGEPATAEANAADPLPDEAPIHCLLLPENRRD